MKAVGLDYLKLKKPEDLIPAIVQDHRTKDVLMLAYVNLEAISKTLETGLAHFWSRSRGRLWMKGETSGNTQKVKEIRVDCDGDAVLYLVEPAGPACHTGERTCFHNRLRCSQNTYIGRSEQKPHGRGQAQEEGHARQERDRRTRPNK